VHNNIIYYVCIILQQWSGEFRGMRFCSGHALVSHPGICHTATADPLMDIYYYYYYYHHHRYYYYYYLF